ncbi:hypothetical protein DAPPUDRAFT_261583 [Daphnia pulex]|uniref:Uncharacterized protein n=1 Tax=Daphnia pulex TaxID=6669 RepID=E9HL88_DAPPU|nr:hypothetical protein DAPPUDRAFT_261583 [Daphnia pulex]|eukprot:EFX67494.1 hypothetical protein DAPPUDRAFT_261583 [Daphnia pulex]
MSQRKENGQWRALLTIYGDQLRNQSALFEDVEEAKDLCIKYYENIMMGPRLDAELHGSCDLVTPVSNGIIKVSSKSFQSENCHPTAGTATTSIHPLRPPPPSTSTSSSSKSPAMSYLSCPRADPSPLLLQVSVSKPAANITDLLMKQTRNDDAEHIRPSRIAPRARARNGRPAVPPSINETHLY